MLACFFEQHQNAVDVGLNERARFHQRTIDVRLGCEVDYDIDAAAVDTFVCVGDVLWLGDIAMKKAIVRLPLILRQILANAGVRQLVEVHDLSVVAVFVEKVTNEIGSDKTGTAGDEVAHEGTMLYEE